MSTYGITSPPHAGAAVTLVAPGGTSGDLAPTGSGLALLVVNGATSTTVTLTPPPVDGLTVGTRTVVIASNSTNLIPLPASVYGAGTTAIGYANVTTLTGSSNTGVAVITVPGS